MWNWKKTSLIIVVLVLVTLGVLAYFKPNALHKLYNITVRYLNPNPQTSSVRLPNQEVIGIDISTYQGKINWNELEFRYDSDKQLTKEEQPNKRPVDFVVAKATEGVTIRDPQYADNRKGARDKKIPFGAYHYFSVTSDAQQQANNFIQTAQLQKGDLVPILDVEYQGKLSTDELRSRVKSWLLTVEKHYGRKPIIYTYANFYEDVFMTKEFNDYHFWLAHYKVAKPQNECTFWQFTEDGVVCGIKGYVDIDVFFGKKKEFEKYKL